MTIRNMIAVRTFARLYSKLSQESAKAAQADASFDCGEFSGAWHCEQWLEDIDRLCHMVASRFNMKHEDLWRDFETWCDADECHKQGYPRPHVLSHQHLAEDTQVPFESVYRYWLSSTNRMIDGRRFQSIHEALVKARRVRDNGHAVDIWVEYNRDLKLLLWQSPGPAPVGQLWSK